MANNWIGSNERLGVPQKRHPKVFTAPVAVEAIHDRTKRAVEWATLVLGGFALAAGGEGRTLLTLKR